MHRPEPDMNLAAMILRQADLSHDRTAMVFEGESYDYAEFARRARTRAALFRQHGTCVGDRVGFLGFNQPAFLETMVAANALGAVFVPLNFRLTGEELAFIIGDAGIHTLVVEPELAPIIDSVKERLPCRAYFSSGEDSEGYPSLASLADPMVPLSETVPVGAHDTLLIMYTSGTTGLPKGAMLTHGNFVWNNFNASLAFGNTRDDVMMCTAPLFHIGGLNTGVVSSLQLGNPIVMTRHFDPGVTLELIQKHRVTHMFGAPAMFLFMSQHPEFEATDLSSINFFMVGGAPVPEPLIHLYGSRGVRFCQGYGLTETAPFSAFLGPDKALSKIGSAGLPPVLSDVRIVDADNRPVAANERGEICLRGPNIMKGYWNRPEATAEAIDSEGWFHSGDVGYLDEEGFLYICDRVKDMVISGGENVYPAEVESVLFAHESIAEVAVIGLPDEKWGEAVTAVVALHEGHTLTLEALREFAADKLAKYKLPIRMHTIDALPRNPAGKILKFQLRETLRA
jgi:fatty-acyl-CoA synthase